MTEQLQLPNGSVFYERDGRDLHAEGAARALGFEHVNLVFAEPPKA